MMSDKKMYNTIITDNDNQSPSTYTDVIDRVSFFESKIAKLSRGRQDLKLFRIETAETVNRNSSQDSQTSLQSASSFKQFLMKNNHFKVK